MLSTLKSAFAGEFENLQYYDGVAELKYGNIILSDRYNFKSIPQNKWVYEYANQTEGTSVTEEIVWTKGQRVQNIFNIDGTVQREIKGSFSIDLYDDSNPLASDISFQKVKITDFTNYDYLRRNAEDLTETVYNLDASISDGALEEVMNSEYHFNVTDTNEIDQVQYFTPIGGKTVHKEGFNPLGIPAQEWINNFNISLENNKYVQEFTDGSYTTSAFGDFYEVTHQERVTFALNYTGNISTSSYADATNLNNYSRTSETLQIIEKEYDDNMNNVKSAVDEFNAKVVRTDENNNVFGAAFDGNNIISTDFTHVSGRIEYNDNFTFSKMAKDVIMETYVVNEAGTKMFTTGTIIEREYDASGNAWHTKELLYNIGTEGSLPENQLPALTGSGSLFEQKYLAISNELGKTTLTTYFDPTSLSGTKYFATEVKETFQTQRDFDGNTGRDEIIRYQIDNHTILTGGKIDM
ncbi:MAG: hypothetical protein ACD_79C01192G0001, partial [uncultured bacterium]